MLDPAILAKLQQRAKRAAVERAEKDLAEKKIGVPDFSDPVVILASPSPVADQRRPHIPSPVAPTRARDLRALAGFAIVSRVETKPVSVKPSPFRKPTIYMEPSQSDKRRQRERFFEAPDDDVVVYHKSARGYQIEHRHTLGKPVEPTQVINDPTPAHREAERLYKRRQNSIAKMRAKRERELGKRLVYITGSSAWDFPTDKIK